MQFEPVITSRGAARLGPTPRRGRTREAHRLLSRGQATLRAVATAWWGGDIEAARRDIYGDVETREGP
jgi:hypothetical protein